MSLRTPSHTVSVSLKNKRNCRIKDFFRRSDKLSVLLIHAYMVKVTQKCIFRMTDTMHSKKNILHHIKVNESRYEQYRVTPHF